MVMLLTNGNAFGTNEMGPMYGITTIEIFHFCQCFIGTIGTNVTNGTTGNYGITGNNGFIESNAIVGTNDANGTIAATIWYCFQYTNNRNDSN